MFSGKQILSISHEKNSSETKNEIQHWSIISAELK